MLNVNPRPSAQSQTQTTRDLGGCRARGGGAGGAAPPAAANCANNILHKTIFSYFYGFYFTF